MGTVGDQRVEAGGTKGAIRVNGGQASGSVNKWGARRTVPMEPKESGA